MGKSSQGHMNAPIFQLSARASQDTIAGLCRHRARVARASLGTAALAAWSWMFRPRKIPWDAHLVARI
jgi:hypothetical protein